MPAAFAEVPSSTLHPIRIDIDMCMGTEHDEHARPSRTQTMKIMKVVKLIIYIYVQNLELLRYAI